MAPTSPAPRPLTTSTWSARRAAAARRSLHRPVGAHARAWRRHPPCVGPPRDYPGRGGAVEACRSVPCEAPGQGGRRLFTLRPAAVRARPAARPSALEAFVARAEARLGRKHGHRWWALDQGVTHKIATGDSDLINVRFSNRPPGSSTFRLSATLVSKSLTGSRFSSDSAPRPFHRGIRSDHWTFAKRRLVAIIPMSQRRCTIWLCCI
jgi:hypothetical protein